MAEVIEVPSGLEGVVAFSTEIAEPDREGGALRYRGIDIEDLVGKVPFEKVWGLLVDGSFEPGMPPAEPHPLAVRTGDPRVDLQAALAMLGSEWGLRELIDISDEQARDDLARVSVMALSFVAQSARGIGLKPVPQREIDKAQSIPERFLIRWRGEADPRHVQAIDAYWISAAEHGMNASTFTARVIASTGADVAAALSGAVGALSGPLHGGAPSRVLKMLDDVAESGNAEAYVKDLLDRGERLMGFGHRVYRAEDPRARVLRRTAKEIGAPRVDAAEALEEAALKELHERKPDRVLATNVEFWSAVVLDYADVPPELFTPLFSCARVAGWSAHILEQKREGRLIRPTAKYVGPPPRSLADAEGGSRSGVTEHPVSSFAKSLFLGEIHEDMVFPFPKPDPDEQEKIRALCQAARDIPYDPYKVEEDRWVGDDTIAAFGEAGLCGLYVPEEYGGQGLSQTGYCRVSEVFASIDATLSVVMGVHMSIGMKGIVLFGTDEQKERFLPDLCSGRKLAGFALTEPGAGSDVASLETTAERQSDGSWRLDGKKHYIGNGSKGSTFVTFASTGEDEHTAFIVESDMDGFEVGHRFDTLGLRGNDLRELTYNGIRVPPENVLGEPGDGFKIAMHILNNGRMSLGSGSVGGAKKLLNLSIDHVRERRQFGQPLADFELVQDKIGWMVSYLFGLESMTYLSTGLVDAGVPDYSLESAVIKISGTEFIWYQVNRSLQLAGGKGYMNTEPYQKYLRDTRIFPIFEGANDVLRAFVALGGLKALGEDLGDLGDLELGRPISSLGILADYAAGRIKREVRPDRITKAHDELDSFASSVGDQVKHLRSASESLLRKHGKKVMYKQFAQKRLADATADIYAQIAVLSRVTSIFEDQGVEPSGQERYIAQTFCERAAHRVNGALEQIESNDDERMTAIAKLAYKRGEYGYAFFED